MRSRASCYQAVKSGGIGLAGIVAGTAVRGAFMSTGESLGAR